MKKLFLMLCVAVMGIGSLSAQKGLSAAGINLGYGSEMETFHLGAKYQYGITDALRIEGAFNYWFEDKEKCPSCWDIDVTAHYLFSVAENLNLYPLAGVMYFKPDWSDVDGSMGLNIGAGAEYSVAENIAINLEAKYQKLFDKDLEDFDQTAISIGATYKF